MFAVSLPQTNDLSSLTAKEMMLLASSLAGLDLLGQLRTTCLGMVLSTVAFPHLLTMKRIPQTTKVPLIWAVHRLRFPSHTPGYSRLTVDAKEGSGCCLDLVVLQKTMTPGVYRCDLRGFHL